LESQIAGLSGATHTHSISEVNLLQAALDLKATKTYVDQVASGLASDIASITISDETGDIANLQASIDAINTAIQGLPTQQDVDSKIGVAHTHTIADITDLSANFYQKTEVDTKLSEQTHTEQDITDLDKYTQTQTDLIVSDHASIKNNPHEVTKEQVGLGNVENFSVTEIFDQAGSTIAKKTDIDALNVALGSHKTETNPHAVTKSHIGLGNVPNVNVQQLLNNHLSASNPHNINLSSFDIYSKAETDGRVQFHLDNSRYQYTPQSSSDSAGAVGDMAYDSNNLYIKTGSNEWKRVQWDSSF
jgi:hypothetical protein